MKKTITIALLVSVLTIGVVGYAYAQSPTPSEPDVPGTFGTGFGGRGARAMMGGLRLQAADGAYGPLHGYMTAALAEAFGLTTDELEARHAEGLTLWDLAQEQGLSAEQFSEKMTAARSSAYQQAVAEGIITQAQADWMLERMNLRQAAGFGPGSENCDGNGPGDGPSRGSMGGFGRGGGRWNAQP